MSKNKKNISIAASILILILVIAGVVLIKEMDSKGSSKPTSSASVYKHNGGNQGAHSEGSAKVVFSPEGVANADEEQLMLAASIIEKRLMDREIIDYKTSVDTDARTISVDFSWDTNEAGFNAEKMIMDIRDINKVMLVKGISDAPADSESSDNVIIGSKDIISADVVTVNSADSEKYYIRVGINDESKNRFKAAVDEIAGTNTQFAFWLDNSMIYAAEADEMAVDGAFMIKSNIISLNEAKKLASSISNGELPFRLKIESYKEN